MNLDKLKRFPNQIIEKRFDECTGETWADIVGNITNQPMDAGFSYAAALRINNTIPTTAGSNPYSGGLGTVVFGCLPTEDLPFDATTTSELYQANINNYGNHELALNFAQNGLQNLYNYEDISDYLEDGKAGVQLAVTWYESFNRPNQDGTLPEPSGNTSNHCVAVYEDSLLGLRIKPWIGPTYGDGGYGYMSKSLLQKVFLQASGINFDSYRWTSLVRILLSRWYLFDDIYPQVSK